MKKRILSITTSIATLALAPISLNAIIIATEDFDYSDGVLEGNNGGTGWSTAWGDANGNTSNNAMEVSGNTAILTSPSPGNGFIFRGLNTAFAASGSIWISLDFQHDAGAFNGLQLFEGANERALIGNLGVAGNPNGVWTLAKDGNANGSDASSVSSTTLKTGIVHYDITAGTGALWVGSGVGLVSITGAPVATITGLTLAGVDTIRFGTGGGGIIDSIRIGTTRLDVAAVPEPGTTTAFMGAMVSCFAYLIRRRK